MAWTNSLILGLGAMLVAVPILLHFLMQPKPKQLVFPAMRFLKKRQQANRSRLRLRHLLLLFMRCLLIGLVVLALAGPTVASREFGQWLTVGGIGFSGLIVGLILLASFLMPRKNWLLIGILAFLFAGHLIYGGWSAMQLLNSENAVVLGDSQAPVAALIVLDTSPRMEYRQENRTRLEVAKEMAQWLISQFPLDSQVCVLATDNDRPFFSVDVAAASRRVETIETTFVENPAPSALAEGLQILLEAPQDRKEIYVVTDLSRQSWIGDQTKPVLRRLKENPEISLFVIDVGVERPLNFSLSSLELSGEEITPNSNFQLSTQVSRIGDAAQRTVKMVIEKPDATRPVVRDGAAVFPEETLEEQSTSINIRENGSARVPFQFSKPLPAGTYHGRLEIEGEDGLSIDDQRHFTIRVRPAWQILVAHPDNVSPRNLLSTIAPSINQELRPSVYECTVVPQSELATYTDLSKFDGIFLLNPKPISENGWQNLDSYVTNGGGLAICLGNNAAQGAFADPRFLTDNAKKLLTGTLSQQWLNEERDLFLSPQDLSHPLFKTFRDNETGMLWNRFPVFLHWGIESDDQFGQLPTQTLLSYSNREPALIERRIGSGRVLVMTTPITERAVEQDRRVWNELFVGKFLPAWMLVRAMTAYLVQNDEETLNVAVGQIARIDNDLRQYPEVYQVFSPRADKPPTTVNAIKGQLKYRFTDYPGQYRLKGVFDDKPVVRGFSANLPESATDLTRIELDELDAILGPDRYQLARQKNEIQRQQGTTRRGEEFYPVLLLMMLVVFAVEYLMSNRFYQTR